MERSGIDQVDFLRIDRAVHVEEIHRNGHPDRNPGLRLYGVHPGADRASRCGNVSRGK